MLKHLLIIVIAFAFATAQTYTLATATTTNAGEATKLELTMADGTLPVYKKLTFKYTMGNATPALAAETKDFTTCCVTAVTSTDPLASTYLNRCFGLQLHCTKSGATCAAAANFADAKYGFYAGVKHTDGKFYNGQTIIAPAVLAAANFGTSTITLPDISLQRPLVSAVGLDTATSSDYTLTCSFVQAAAQAGAPDPTAAAGYTIPTSGTTAVTVTKTGTYTCSTTSSSRSAGYTGLIAPTALLAAVAALIALD